MEENYKENLRIQIREAYGRLLYSYTCFNKMIGNLSRKLNCLQLWQIVLSAITTGGILTAVIVDERIITIISCVVSTFSTGISLYLKNYNLNDLIRQFHCAADEAWLIREDYISLLTDFDELENREIVKRREELKIRVYELYKKYPKSDSKSYKQAQHALKNEEEQFFKTEEIDRMLPQHLRMTENPSI